MGARGNIVVKSGGEQICLYSHWGGRELPTVLASALLRGKGRWNDFQYLTRIIFCEMIPIDCWMDLTGYGITNNVHDNEFPIITVNVDDGTVQIEDMTAVMFADYIAAIKKS